jgi:hypothetical protein
MNMGQQLVKLVACGAILLKKAIYFLIFHQLGVEVFENPKVNFHVHSSVEEYWVDDSTARNCAPNSNFLIVKRTLMQNVRIFGQPVPSILSIHMARKMKLCLITHEIQCQVEFTIHNLLEKPLAILHTFFFIIWQ